MSTYNCIFSKNESIFSKYEARKFVVNTPPLRILKEDFQAEEKVEMINI